MGQLYLSKDDHMTVQELPPRVRVPEASTNVEVSFVENFPHENLPVLFEQPREIATFLKSVFFFRWRLDPQELLARVRVPDADLGAGAPRPA